MIRGTTGKPLARRIGAFAAGAALIAVMIVGGTAATASAKAVKCGGTPVVIEAEANVSNTAGAQIASEVPYGVDAAAKAVTKTCELGVPVVARICDDQGSPTGAAACGQDAVSNHAIALIAYSSFGDSYAAPVVAAGIPILPVNATSSTESNSTMSFPLGYPITSLFSQMQLAHSAGGSKLALMYLDLPSVQFSINEGSQLAPALGLNVVAKIPIGPTATDMAPYVAQALAAGADSMICIVGPAMQTAIIKNLQQSGKDLTTSFHYVASLTTLTPKTVATLGASLINGLYISGWGYTPTDTSSPIVKQYLSELTAAGQPHGATDVSMLGLVGWGGVHMIADRLSQMKLKPSAANIVKALTSKPSVGPIAVKYGLTRVNYLGVPYKNNGALDALRLFSSSSYYFRFNSSGVPVPLTKTPQSVLSKLTFAK